MLSFPQFGTAMLKDKVTEVMTRSRREKSTHRRQDDNITGCSTMLPVQWHTLHNILFFKYRFTSHLWMVNSIGLGGLYLTVTADANNNSEEVQQKLPMKEWVKSNTKRASMLQCKLVPSLVDNLSLVFPNKQCCWLCDSCPDTLCPRVKRKEQVSRL